MLAYMSSPSQGPLLLPLLLRLARDYPQAVFFPFSVSCADLAKSPDGGM